MYTILYTYDMTYSWIRKEYYMSKDEKYKFLLSLNRIGT